MPYVPMMKENNVRKGFIEYEEFMAFQDALPVYLKPVLIFAYLTGWRRSEILNMQWNQVNLKEGSVRLEPGETKNKDGRTIYMEPELWAVMQKLYKSRDMSCLHVFHSQGKKISDFRGAWGTACKVIGKPGMLFHDLSMHYKIT